MQLLSIEFTTPLPPYCPFLTQSLRLCRGLRKGLFPTGSSSIARSTTPTPKGHPKLSVGITPVRLLYHRLTRSGFIFRCCCRSPSIVRKKSTTSCASVGRGTTRAVRISGRYNCSCSGKIWVTNPNATRKKHRYPERHTRRDHTTTGTTAIEPSTTRHHCHYPAVDCPLYNRTPFTTMSNNRIAGPRAPPPLPPEPFRYSVFTRLCIFVRVPAYITVIYPYCVLNIIV